MAMNATVDQASSVGIESSQEQVSRWQQLFNYSYVDAVDQIQQHRCDVTRQRVSDEHWSLVQAEMEDNGFDREAYEHQMQLGGAKPSQSSHVIGSQQNISSLEENATFIFKLGGPLSGPKEIQIAASLTACPEIMSGFGQEGEAKFCCVGSAAKLAIQSWLSRQRINFQPTFINVSQARKDLSSVSLYPTLGIDVTLPQHRPDQHNVAFVPTQCQYPVWYFFYGTLADTVTLSRLLDLPKDNRPVLTSATISHGDIKLWGGKYKSLVDAQVQRVSMVGHTKSCRETTSKLCCGMRLQSMKLSGVQ